MSVQIDVTMPEAEAKELLISEVDNQPVQHCV
jgi:hypothetical protein